VTQFLGFGRSFISLRQELVPDQLLVRVTATVRMLSWRLALGSLAGGGLGTWLGLRPTMLIAGIGLSVPTVIL
jgi:hypothetical protein